MKKLIIAMGLLSPLAATHAQDETKPKGWVGGFIEHYQADEDKPGPVGYMDNGTGFGAEIGYRIMPKWAARLEFAELNIDGKTVFPDEDGFRFGVDALYFLEDDWMYLFGGLKSEKLDKSYRLMNLGLGKHWKLTDSLQVITEAAAYHDFGQAHKDYSIKLGLAYTFGAEKSAPKTPTDADNDGVFDAQDRCPNTPAGTKVDNSGCNVDKDGDGVVNSIDQCPNTPKGTPVGAKGCSLELDADQDGVLDSADKCAQTPLTDKVDAMGCSIFVEKEVSVALNVLFDNNSAKVNNPDDQQFADFAAFMKRFPNTDASIEGHTSAVGEASYNQGLSEQRASAVRQLLIEQYDIAGSRLKAVGYGESRLLDSALSAAAHKVNRRIEAKVTATKKEKVLK